MKFLTSGSIQSSEGVLVELSSNPEGVGKEQASNDENCPVSDQTECAKKADDTEVLLLKGCALCVFNYLRSFYILIFLCA